MMSPDSMSKRFGFRRLCPLCAIMAFAILSCCRSAPPRRSRMIRRVLTPGLHDLKLPRADEPDDPLCDLHSGQLFSVHACPAHSCVALRGPARLGRRRWGRGADPHWSGARGTRRHHRRAGFGARRLEQPRKREGGERIARHGPGPLRDRQEKSRGHRLQHGRRRLLAFCGKIPGTLQRGDSSRRQAAGVRRRVAASGSGDSFARRPGRAFWPDGRRELRNFRKPA